MDNRHYHRILKRSRKGSGPRLRSPGRFGLLPWSLSTAKTLIISIVICIALGLTTASPLLALQASPTDPESVRKLKIASTEHELILVLIQSGSFDKIELEWKKVLDLKLGPQYEGAVAKSLLTIAFKLYEAKQLALAQALLDSSLAGASFSNKNKADILRFKAFLYKESGELEKAIETYKRAIELEKP